MRSCGEHSSVRSEFHPHDSRDARLARLVDFVMHDKFQSPEHTVKAISLFSGAGVGDIGFSRAGFEFHAQVEINPSRASVGAANHPQSTWFCRSVSDCSDDVIQSWKSKFQSESPGLVVISPPCQGMSTSNPGRGSRSDGSAAVQERRNALLLDAASVVKSLRPEFVLIENVRQIRTLHVGGTQLLLLHQFWSSVGEGYKYEECSVDFSEWGLPQRRARAIVLGIRNDIAEALGGKQLLGPFIAHMRSEHADFGYYSISDWIDAVRYEALDAGSLERARGTHTLHFVPVYDRKRYRLVSDIPPRSGRSAYENDICPTCAAGNISMGVSVCPECFSELYNRPVVQNADGSFRLVRGFKSSYRRAPPDLPSPTMTTASGHIGSDIKIHPWENRLMSVLECADLQSIPRSFDWSPALGSQGKPKYNVVREIVGEAIPPWCTYLLGCYINRLHCAAHGK
jgi:DNA (cytosine-5)-methyltransferase 1